MTKSHQTNEKPPEFLPLNRALLAVDAVLCDLHLSEDSHKAIQKALEILALDCVHAGRLVGRDEAIDRITIHLEKIVNHDRGDYP